MNVIVDGQSCGDLASRDKILKAQNENNVALAFDEVASANKEKIRELFQKKNVVYVYHNQVDARGDKLANENEVFTACSEAIGEIHKLIKKLTSYISAPKFFITAVMVSCIRETSCMNLIRYPMTGKSVHIPINGSCLQHRK